MIFVILGMVSTGMTDDKLLEMQAASKQRRRDAMRKKERGVIKKAERAKKYKQIVDRKCAMFEMQTMADILRADHYNRVDKRKRVRVENKKKRIDFKILNNILIFDGTDIESVRVLFTPTGRLKRTERVQPPKPIVLENSPRKGGHPFINPETIRDIVAKRENKEPAHLYHRPFKKETIRLPELPEYKSKEPLVRPKPEYDNHRNPLYPVYNELAKERIKKTG